LRGADPESGDVAKVDVGEGDARFFCSVLRPSARCSSRERWSAAARTSSTSAKARGGEGGDVGDGGRGGSGGAPTTTTATTTTTTTTTGGGPNLELVDEVEISGESDVVVTVQPGTLGITTVSTTKADPFAEIYMTRLTAPSGAVVVDGSLPSNGWYWASYGILGAATPQVSHPETFPLAPGSWTFHFSSATPGRGGRVAARHGRRQFSRRRSGHQPVLAEGA
jgi:hypothetical protein